MPNKKTPAKKAPAKSVESAVTELNRVRKEWLRRPGVTAVDVGYKLKDGKLTDEVAIRIHVKRKLPIDALSEHDRFSDRARPAKLGAFSIDVVEAEYGPAHAAPAVIEAPEDVDRRDRVDPLVGGVSVGNPRISAGTLGAVVWDRTDCEVCILSNWHVLCGGSACTADEAIYQPGRADGGVAADTAAELKRWRLDQDTDAALARLTGSRTHSRDILGLNPIVGLEENPALGMNVSKSGRTTGVTQGMIDGVSLSVTLNYGGGTVQTFNGQLHIIPRPPWPAVDYEVSRGGDSGSVWIADDTGRAVGLHFAGETDASPSAEHAIANRMVRVADLLNFSFTPLFCRPRVPIDDRWRNVIRRILCRRYPWLCSGWPPLPWPPSPWSRELDPPSTIAPSTCGMPVPDRGVFERRPAIAPIEELLDEIMRELRPE
jgi:endonuclease G